MRNLYDSWEREKQSKAASKQVKDYVAEYRGRAEGVEEGSREHGNLLAKYPDINFDDDVQCEACSGWHSVYLALLLDEVCGPWFSPDDEGDRWYCMVDNCLTTCIVDNYGSVLDVIALHGDDSTFQNMPPDDKLQRQFLVAMDRDPTERELHILTKKVYAARHQKIRITRELPGRRRRPSRQPSFS